MPTPSDLHPRLHMPELEPLILQRPELQQRVQRARLRNLQSLQCDRIHGRGHTHARIAETQEDAAGAKCVRDGLRAREGESEKGSVRGEVNSGRVIQ